MKVLCTRTQMCGGGTAYDVLFPVSSKPSRPLYGYSYATEVVRDGENYYHPGDAIMRRATWTNLPNDPGSVAVAEYRRTQRVASRLSARIAARAFPELAGRRTLPALWADWTLPSADVWIDVSLTLPE